MADRTRRRLPKGVVAVPAAALGGGFGPLDC
jgi:hypothetical protein